MPQEQPISPLLEVLDGLTLARIAAKYAKRYFKKNHDGVLLVPIPGDDAFFPAVEMAAKLLNSGREWEASLERNGNTCSHELRLERAYGRPKSLPILPRYTIN